MKGSIFPFTGKVENWNWETLPLKVGVICLSLDPIVPWRPSVPFCLTRAETKSHWISSGDIPNRLGTWNPPEPSLKAAPNPRRPHSFQLLGKKSKRIPWSCHNFERWFWANFHELVWGVGSKLTHDEDSLLHLEIPCLLVMMVIVNASRCPLGQNAFGSRY